MNTIEREHDNPLGYEKVSALLRKFAVPHIVAMLVSLLYNIVDQIFIGQGVMWYRFLSLLYFSFPSIHYRHFRIRG